MYAGPVLELTTGEPRWMVAAPPCLLLIVIAALLVTPLQWPWTAGLLAWSMTVVWRAAAERQRRARFPNLRVCRDFSVSLIDQFGGETGVDIEVRAWVSPWLIVVTVRLPTGDAERFVVSRALNSRDAFRRFTVISRFGFAVQQAERQNVPESNTTGA